MKGLNKKWLRHHNKRLGVKIYMDFYKLKDFPKELRSDYTLKGYPYMLFLPRAIMNEHRCLCCAACDNSMHKTDSRKKPPKLSITNGFVIGKFPKLSYTDDNGKVCEFNIESNLTDVMHAMLAPTRTHSYVMAFVGGKHNSIMGHYQFFEMDQTRVGGVINHICHNAKR